MPIVLYRYRASQYRLAKIKNGGRACLPFDSRWGFFLVKVKKIDVALRNRLENEEKESLRMLDASKQFL